MPKARTVLDIGCGWGELLLRVLAAVPSATGRGVDLNAEALARARANAAGRGLDVRVRFDEAPAPVRGEEADLVLCVGSDHAYGSQAEALGTLRGLIRTGGRLLFGSGFWEKPPRAAQAASCGHTPDSLHDLAGLVDLAVEVGLRLLFIETADRSEWEAFESGYLADWEEWLHAHLDAENATAYRERADAHRRQWLRGYRDVLGFAYLISGAERSAHRLAAPERLVRQPAWPVRTATASPRSPRREPRHAPGSLVPSASAYAQLRLKVAMAGESAKARPPWPASAPRVDGYGPTARPDASDQPRRRGTRTRPHDRGARPWRERLEQPGAKRVV